jgi:hypothetical protein
VTRAVEEKEIVAEEKARSPGRVWMSTGRKERVTWYRTRMAPL